MSISSLQLDAFYEVAKAGSFSKAAIRLHITQSALSQRILKLEDEISTSLIVRDSSGLRLTQAGQKLLRYCQTKDSLEKEMLYSITNKSSHSLAGEVRIGSFSTVTRSVILNSLKKLIRVNQNVHLEVFSREIRELPALLRSGEVDYVVLDQVLRMEALEHHLLGYEENVLIEPLAKGWRDGVFLDHDWEDMTTLSFLKLNRKTEKNIKRLFLDDIYGIIDGVSLGWGRAVVPKHLLRGIKGVRVVQGYKPLLIPLYLCYYEQPYYSQLHEVVTKNLIDYSESYLS